MLKAYDEKTISFCGKMLTDMTRQELVNAIGWLGEWILPVGTLPKEQHDQIFNNPTRKENP